MLDKRLLPIYYKKIHPTFLKLSYMENSPIKNTVQKITPYKK